MNVADLPKRINIRTKLIAVYVLVSILPVVLIQGVMYSKSLSLMKMKVSTLIDYNLEQTAKNLETTLAYYDDFIQQIVIDDIMIDHLEKFNNGSKIQRVMSHQVMRDRLALLAFIKKGIHSIAIFPINGPVVCYSKRARTQTSNIWSEYPDIRQSQIYRRATEANGTVYSLQKNLDGNRQIHLFHLSRRIVDLRDMELLGVLVISLDDTVLFNVVNYGSLQEQQRISSLSLILNEQGIVYSSSNKDLLGHQVNNWLPSEKTRKGLTSLSLLAQSETKKPPKLIINKYSISHPDWTVVNILHEREVFREIFTFQVITFAIGFLAVAFSLCIILCVSNGIATSIKKIVEGMQTAQQGEFTVQVNLDTRDEISILAHSFNKMITEIHRLMEEVKLQMNKACEATRREKEAEIRALESQVNPHFLFNTIDSINWMAIEKEEYEISKRLKFLAEILRYSIKDSHAIVKIQDEVNWLKKYIFLQRDRFDNSFDYSIEIEERVMDLKIHKMILQPFIENAIVHGFEDREGGGFIRIAGRMHSNNTVEFTIEDNGKGITQQELSSLMEQMEKKDGEEPNGDHLGIRNSHDRMKAYYGDKSGLALTSKSGQGTTVILQIPRIT